MNTVERVKLMCLENHVTISALEQACGFANGYIGQLKKGVIPSDRVVKIAEFFNTTPEYIITGRNHLEINRAANDMYSDTDMQTFYRVKQNMSPVEFEALMTIIRKLDKEVNTDATEMS